MRIVLIGAGNLATNLGKALSHAEHEIVQIYSRTMVSARGLAHEVGGTPITDLKSLCNDADVYVVALKDSVVGDLLPQICKGREERLFVHTSGSLPMDILPTITGCCILCRLFPNRGRRIFKIFLVCWKVLTNRLLVC